MSMKKTMMMVLGVLGILGCDEGREPLERCRKAFEAGEFEGGNKECGEALRLGTGKSSGREARKLQEQYKTQIDEAVKVAAKKAEELRIQEWNRAQAAKAERKAYLARKVKAVWIRNTEGSYEDSFCQGDGYGPYWREYSGGTWAENEEAAGLDGCRSRAGRTGKDFCCPNGPKYVW